MHSWRSRCEIHVAVPQACRNPKQRKEIILRGSVWCSQPLPRPRDCEEANFLSSAAQEGKMSGFFQMPPADWFFIPVPIASLCPSSGNLADHAGITAENLTGLTTCNAFHMMPPAFISHNPFAAFHPGRIAVLSPNWAFQPGQLGPPVNSTPFPGLTGGVPQALHPSLSVQSGVATTAGAERNLTSEQNRRNVD